MTDIELANLAIKNENTPELGQYWEKRYEIFLKNKVFILSDKTRDLLGQDFEINAPATPYGYLNLPVFVGKNKIIDEIMLQNCIETSIRFLDSILDIINFSSEAKQIIAENRKIGLGIINFDEYLLLRDVDSKIDEIDYIGEIISSSSYRSSEALAEEKGACLNWDSLSLLIRPKSFEYWYNSENGEIKSGLDVAEEYTSNNVIESNFEIIPRRNSHILLYPNDTEWQIWSDRDDSSIITDSHNISKKDLQEKPFISTGQDDNNDYISSFEQEKPNEIKDNSNYPKENIFDTPLHDNAEIPFDIKSKVEEILAEQNSEIKTNINDNLDLPLLNPLTSIQQKITSWFEISPESEKLQPSNYINLNKIVEPTFVKTPEINNIPIPAKSSKDIFQTQDNYIPEVQIKFEDLNLKKSNSDLKSTNNDVIITKILKPIKIQIIILSSDGKGVLVDQDNRLPIIDYKFVQDPEDFIIIGLKQMYGIDVDFIEISSIDLFNDDLYIVYQTKIHEWIDGGSKLHLQSIDELLLEEDIVGLSKAIDRIRRWKKSAKLKAEQLVEEKNNSEIKQCETIIKDLTSQLETQSNESKKQVDILHQQINEQIDISNIQISELQNQLNSKISEISEINENKELEKHLPEIVIEPKIESILTFENNIINQEVPIIKINQDSSNIDITAEMPSIVISVKPESSSLSRLMRLKKMQK